MGLLRKTCFCQQAPQQTQQCVGTETTSVPTRRWFWAYSQAVVLSTVAHLMVEAVLVEAVDPEAVVHQEEGSTRPHGRLRPHKRPGMQSGLQG